jgi:MinD superfamily P-loop ATPase
LKELVVISGKGGTGKTSLLASFAALAESAVTVDCDVDAADLHLVLAPTVERITSFTGGMLARIDSERCTACGECAEHCRYGAIRGSAAAGPGAETTYTVDPFACEGCGVCRFVCPAGAILLEEETNGEWYVSSTRCGPMVHAKLKPGGENSGKLVTLVRAAAKHIAEERGADLLLIDGSPGIGCPVIASITGADLVLVVTEPTRSGVHDLERVVELTRHFRIPVVIAVNKADINEEMTAAVRRYAAEERIELIGCIRYDTEVTRAQMEGRSVVEISRGKAAADIRAIWEQLGRHILEHEREGS